MEIKRFNSGILFSNMYVIEENGHAIVIDPAKNILPGKQLKIDLLIITHEHNDHISGVNAWKNLYKAPLLCSENCANRIIDSRKNQARHFDVFCEIKTWKFLKDLPEIDTTYTCQADKSFKEERILFWQNHRINLIEILGHSPGGIGVYLDNDYFFRVTASLRIMI